MARKKKKNITLSEMAEQLPATGKKHWSKFSDQDIINALALYDLYHSVPKVAAELHISEGTVREWVYNQSEFIINRKAGMVDYDIRIQETRNRMIRSMGYVLDKSLQVISDKLEDSSAAQAATIFGILYDKLDKAVNNDSTVSSGITVNVNMSDNDKLDLLQRVLDRQKAAAEAEQKIIDIEESEIQEVDGGQ